MSDRWAHQPREIAHALDPARALYWSPRTGKTRTMVKSMERQALEGRCRRLLVIAPQFVCRTVWVEEAASSDVFGVIDLSHGKMAARKAALQQLRDNALACVVVLINWEALAPMIEDLLKWKPEVVIADESHYAKSPSTARSRALHRLGRVARFRRALTGTPTPRDYIDLYSQYKFLDPTIFGTNKEKFVQRYVELDFFKRPKYYLNLPELRAKMLSVASVFDRAKEWKDLPPLEIRRQVSLPPAARKVYDDLVRKTVAEFEGVRLSVPHKLARLVKLQQLTAGFITTGEGDADAQWVHTAKIDAVIAELDDLLPAGEKAVVFYQFKPEGKRLEETIREKFGAVVGRIGGDTPLGYRERIQKSFLGNGPESVRVIVMQSSLGIGISLRSANYLIRTSYPLDYAKFEQSNERIYSDPNQNRTFITLETPNSVDGTARRICTKKEEASGVLMHEDFASAAYGRLNLEAA